MDPFNTTNTPLQDNVGNTSYPMMSYFLVTSCTALLLAYFPQWSKSDIPVLNPQATFELTFTRSRRAFITDARDMIVRWFRRHPDKPARVVADIGMMTILPPCVANEIRNDSRLDFAETLRNVFHTHLPGFEGLKPAHEDKGIVLPVLVKELTKYLSKVTGPLSKEAEIALSEIFTDEKEWHRVLLKDGILKLVSRMSSRVFLGEELCRNPAWLSTTTEYTTTVITAAEQLRIWPKPLRYFVHWFLPSCRKLRSIVKRARKIISPVIDHRRQEKLAHKAEGRTVVYEDMMEWFDRSSKGRPYDPALTQLFVAFSAINSTADLICQVIIDIARHPEIIEPLRREIITVLADGGWQKMSLYNMRLLDSVIKESQRLKPITTAPMRRMALDHIKLSDGTVIQKGQMAAVSPHLMWADSVYEKPDEWDGYRFYTMRQIPGKENVSQLVSTSPDHLGFGHGSQACPGRFFAANEMKIALSHLLLKYDWKLSPGSEPTIRPYGVFLMADPTTKVIIRRREEEVKLELHMPSAGQLVC